MRTENKTVKFYASYAEVKDTEREDRAGTKMELDHYYWVKWERWQLY